MIEFEQALQKVTQMLPGDFDGADGDDELIVVIEETIERPFGWVFFYTSKKLLETGDPRYFVAGNGPFIVNRHSGQIVETGTAFDIDHYIDEYEKSLN